MVRRARRQRPAIITQNHMVELAGSEVLSLELADALTERDHEVTIYAHVTGDPIAQIAHDRGLRLTDNADALTELEVGLGWIHHQVIPPAVAAAIGAPDTTVVCGHMSPFEPLESTFLGLEDSLTDVVVANSLETAEALQDQGVVKTPIVVLGNPAPDAFWHAATRPRQTLRRLLFVSNHMPSELIVAMGRLRAAGLEIDHVGGPGRTALLVPADIAGADAVVSIGKTVQAALAVGRPVFCYDIHGGPGWLTSENVSLAQAHNFSGRPFDRMTSDEIVEAVTNGFARATVEVGSLRDVLADANWSRGLDRVFSTARATRHPQPLAATDRRRLDAYFQLARRTAREHYALVRSRAQVHTLMNALNTARVSQADEAAKAAHLNRQLSILRESRSWKLTAPLRHASALLADRGTHAPQRVTRRGSDSVAPMVRRIESLPALAWLCRVTEGRSDLLVGPKVEVSPAGVSEGAWVGPFRHDALLTSPAVFGSGVVFGDQGPVFVPPSHPLEGLFVVDNTRTGDRFVANSMCFALAQVPDPSFRTFVELLRGSIRESVDQRTAEGFDASPIEVLKAEGYRLRRVSLVRFDAPHGVPLGLLQPDPVAPFADYHSYRAFLSASLASLFANATNPSRTCNLQPAVAVSRGYDSSAVAVLAAENGCGKALTLTVNVDGREDSGEAVARKIGLDVTTRPHVLGQRIEHLEVELGAELAGDAFEFLATEGVGDDILYLPFESELGRCLLLTGAWGDSVWARDAALGDRLPVRIPFGKSLTEFRLRVGFAHVPVPFIGGRAADSIADISRCADMASYSVGGHYDRPIPRRIGEEAGLARTEFGSVKTATAPLPLNGEELFVEAVTATCRRYVHAEAV